MKKKLIKSTWRMFSSLLFVCISLVSFVACKLNIRTSKTGNPKPNVSVTKYGVKSPIYDCANCEYGVKEQPITDRIQLEYGVIVDRPLREPVATNSKGVLDILRNQTLVNGEQSEK